MNTDGNENANFFYGQPSAKSGAAGIYTDYTQSSQEDASSLERRSNGPGRANRVLVAPEPNAR